MPQKTKAAIGQLLSVMILFAVLDFPDQIVIGILTFHKACDRSVKSRKVIEIDKGFTDLCKKLG